MKQETTPQIYPNEFSDLCLRHYRLRELLIKRQDKLIKMIDNEPVYQNKHDVTEIDAIILYHTRLEELHGRAELTRASLSKTGENILAVFKYFEIPPFSPLIGQVPDQMEYEVWIDEKDAVYVIKIKDLIPEPNPNLMIIKLWNWTDPDAVDEDLDDPKPEESDRICNPWKEEN